MAMHLDPLRLTGAQSREDVARQHAELREAEEHISRHRARVLVDFTGRGRYVAFEPDDMLLAVRAAKERLWGMLHEQDREAEASAAAPDPALGFAQATSGSAEP